MQGSTPYRPIASPKSSISQFAVALFLQGSMEIV